MNRDASKLTTKVAAVGALTVAIGFAIAPAAIADAGSGDVQVVNTETVQVYMSSTGHIESQRVYEQLALTGKGTVDLRNPIETDGLRNLDGFGGFTVKNGEQIIDTSVDGTKNFRSVSTYSADLPISITPSYKLDGKDISADDLVGKSGRLEVHFKVVNKTAKEQEVTFSDGRGGTVTKTVQVPVPMVGSLTTTAPKNFTEVAAGGANTAGDGQGGTKMSYTMTLFPPLGSDTAEFGYSATVKNAVVPQVDVSMLPVDPMASPTFKSAADSYQGGAETGAQLVAGASEIDSNLLKLRDGAADLLAGLLKLSDGADQLHTGLADDAAPGSQRLADGAGALDDGLGQLEDGTGQLSTGAKALADGTELLSGGASKLAAGAGDLSAGAGKLAAGADDALAGSNQLSAGAGKLSAGLGDAETGTDQLTAGGAQLVAGQQALAGGLKDLYDGVNALPTQVQQSLAQNVDYQRLLGGLQAIADGVGTRADAPTAGTLLGGLNAIQYGMRAPGTTDCQKALAGMEPSNCGALDGVDLISQTVNGALTGPATEAGTVAQLLAGFDVIASSVDCGAVCQATVAGVKGTAETQLTSSLTLIKTSLDSISSKVNEQLLAPGAGLDQLRAGLDMGTPGACDAPGSCGIKQAALTIKGGVPVLVDQLVGTIQQQLLSGIGVPTANCDPTATLRCGAAALVIGSQDLSAGINQLAAGVTKLRAGGLQLADGADALSAGLGTLDAGAAALADGAGQVAGGAGDLSDGATKVNAGAGDLADGAGRVAEGTAKAKDGSGQLADGATKLSDGLDTAADGSGQIADGLGEAAAGAPKLVDGAGRLSTEGMGALTRAGAETAVNYGQLYAEIKAGSERAQQSSMAYGAPKDALGLTAYSFVIKGNDGESSRNWARAGAAALVFAASGGVLFLRRRFI